MLLMTSIEQILWATVLLIYLVPESTPVDGAWGPWQQWGGCHPTCGPDAVKRRHRYCDKPAPQHGGLTCLGLNSSATPCHVADCVTSGSTVRPTSVVGYDKHNTSAVEWSAWSQWYPCSSTCGQGLSLRLRHCGTNNQTTCPGSPYQSKQCTSRACVQHGSWSEWLQWSACSLTCGQGISVRVRSCDHQSSDHGGKACVGPDTDNKQCYMTACTKGQGDNHRINGGWGTWHDWSSCSRSCGDGVQTRIRSCVHPAPKDGGKDCVGVSANSTSCHVVDCPVAYWSSWTRWTGCSATCGGAFTIRVRHCGTNETHCPGDPLEKKSCGPDICPLPAVDGAWGTWQHWTNCSVTCGLGVKTRHRSCDSPAANYGGKPCVGNSTMNTGCESPSCPVRGGWSAWDEWSACTETCGYGFKSRHRSCDNPAPQNGGMPCMGRFSSMTTCDLADC